MRDMRFCFLLVVEYTLDI